MQKILVCDDDKQIVEAIDIYLTGEGFQVIKAYDGLEALELLKTNEVNLMIVDVMMPGLDGIRTTLKVRETSSIPIIILSAKSEDSDKILGLNIGADDYITKPFNPLELVARVKALLRRAGGASQTAQPDQPLEYGPLVLSPELRTAALDGEPLTLTPTEFDFLAYLIQNRDRAVSREELLQALWQVDWQADTRAADDLMKRLRRKLRERDSQVRIETVWGYGFRLVLEEKEL